MELSRSARGLADWCEGERGRAARLAEHLEVSRTTINHYCRGVITPDDDRWPAIAEFTGGAAPADGWRKNPSEDPADERPTLTPDPTDARAA